MIVVIVVVVVIIGIMILVGENPVPREGAVSVPGKETRFVRAGVQIVL